MRKLLIILLLIGFCGISYANSQNVYKRLTRANNIKPLSFVIIKEHNRRECSLACTDGRTLTITTKLLSIVRNEDELAGVIGHEMAHAVYGNEMKADVQGLKYAKRAGYNYCRAAKFLKSLVGDNKHPDGNIRYKNTGCK